MKSDEARRLKELEIENARLKKLVAEQAIDISILKEANDYPGKPRRGGGGSSVRTGNTFFGSLSHWGVGERPSANAPTTRW